MNDVLESKCNARWKISYKFTYVGREGSRTSIILE